MASEDWMTLRSEPDRNDVREGQEQLTITIDSKLMSSRAARKLKLVTQPTGMTETELREHVDRQIASDVPIFDQPMWSLGDMARWILYRTRIAVDGISIDRRSLDQVVQEIQAVLLSGDVPAFATTVNAPVPVQLSKETWAFYDLAIEEKNRLVRIVPYGSDDMHSESVRTVQVPKKDVLSKWPDPTAPQARTTANAQSLCREWLTAMMRDHPDAPKSKSSLRVQALEKFRALSKRGFDRAWDAALQNSGSDRWSQPGPRA